VPRPQTERLVEIGVVGRPHGVRGEARVFLHNPGSEIVQNLDTVLLKVGDAAAHAFRIASVRSAGDHLIVAFGDVETRTNAEALKGARLLVRRDQLPRLEEGEYYVDDLIGLEVVCDGRTVGVVRASREQGGVEVLAVETGSEEMEIPLVEQYVSALLPERSRIEVRDIDDLPRTARSGPGEGRDG